ncbi:MAG: hypothetical protein ABGW69_03635 [Nanoarchaeota archaeon]
MENKRNNENELKKEKTISKRKIEHVVKEREKIRKMENFFYYLFWFLIFLILISGLKYYYDLKTSKIFYQGKLATYYYDKQAQMWYTTLKVGNKTVIIHFENNPKEFEKYPIKFIRRINKNPKYVVIAYKNNTNYAYITKSIINIGRVLAYKGYTPYVNFFQAYLYNNNTIGILDKNLKVVAKGPLNCSLKNDLFIILEPKANKRLLLINGSCVYLYGEENLDFFHGVNLLTMILIKELRPLNERTIKI